MAIFNNQRPDIRDTKDTAKGTDAPVQTMQWDETTDMGVHAQERAESVAAMQRERASIGDSLAAGLKESVVGAAVRKATAPSFVSEPTFDTAKVMQFDPSLRMLGYTQDELEYIGTATSPEEYEYLNSQVRASRARQMDVGDNMLAGITGQLVGDAPFMLMPMGAVGIAGRTGFAIRSGLRAGELATTYYANSELGQPDWVTAVVGGVLAVDQLFDIRRAVVSLEAARSVGQYAARNEALAKAAKDDILSTETGLGARAEASGVKSDAPEIVADTTGASAGRGFDPDAPRTAPGKTVADEDSTVTLVVGGQKSSHTTRKLSEPVTVSRNSAATVAASGGDLIASLRARTSGLSDGARAILEALPKALDNLQIEVAASPATRSRYTFQPSTGKDRVVLRTEAKDGTVFRTADDALKSVPGDVAVHELVHAITSKIIYAVQQGWKVDAEVVAAVKEIEAIRKRIIPELRTGRASYAATNAQEFVAELATNPEFVKVLARTKWDTAQSVLSKVARTILKALGFKGKGTALEAAVRNLETLMLKQVEHADSVNTFLSKGMAQTFNEAGAGTGSVLDRARKLEAGVRAALKQSFALYDNLAAHSKELADLLVSDATRIGQRKTSVVDHKRNLTLEQDLRAAKVEDAFVSAMRQDGVGLMDMFFNRRAALEVRTSLEHDVSVYLDQAYTAELAGRAVPPVPAHISEIVDAYRKSGWAETWHAHVADSGLMGDNTFQKSANYAPRKYSAAKFSKHGPDDVQALLRAALQDIYPSMSNAIAKRVADTWYKRTVNGTRAQDRGGQWKQLINGMDNDELFMAMKDAGIDEADINKFLNVNVPTTGATGEAKHLRKRLRLNVSKEFVVDEAEGRTMRLLDVMDTRLMQNMQGYTNSMSGRVAFARAGVSDLSQIEKQIGEVVQRSLGSGKDTTKWTKAVDDTIDHILGFPVGTDIPELMRGASNIANTVMLKNSGLYQLTDMSIAIKEFGLARTLRAMAETGLLRKADYVMKDADAVQRLHSILNAGYQHAARYRHIHTYCDDNLDLTTTSQVYQTTQNMAQAARLANGFSMVHRMMANLNSGMLVDEVEQMLKGGDSRILRDHGLTDDMRQKMQAAYAAQGGVGVLPRELQQELELVSTRAMDLVMQNIRTGETSHFAQFSPVGKLVIGYQSFAVAATNKLLRRHVQNDDYAGLAMLMMYQYPLMLLATQAKLALDGKEAENPTQLVVSAAMNMSAIGGLSLLSPLFLGETPRHSLTSLGYVTQSIGAIQEMAQDRVLDTQRMSKILPFAQEFMPLRAVINNMGE